MQCWNVNNQSSRKRGERENNVHPFGHKAKISYKRAWFALFCNSHVGGHYKEYIANMPKAGLDGNGKNFGSVIAKY